MSNVVNKLKTMLNFIPRVTVLFLFLSVLRSYKCVMHVTFIVSHIFERFKLSKGDFVPLLVSSKYKVPKVVTSGAVRRSGSEHLAVVATAFVPYKTGLPIVTVVNKIVTNRITKCRRDSFVTPLVCFMKVITMLISTVVLGGAGPFSKGPTPFMVRLPRCRVPRTGAILLRI